MRAPAPGGARPGGPAPAEAANGVRAGRGSLFLPAGTETVYYLDLPGESELALTGLSVRGAGAGELTVTARQEGGEEEVLDTFAAGTGRAAS